MIQATAVSDAVGRVLQLAVSAGVGAFVTIVAFRTRLALNDQKVAALETHIDGRLDLISRRQILTLQILADIAKKEGLDNRFSDAIVRFLTEESGGRRDAD